MPRMPRPNRPGAPFHLTARIQNRAHLFDEYLRGRVIYHLLRRSRVSDVRLLAFVVMTNHLHLVVRQGQQPLGCFMQPFLRSVALSVQHRHGLAGHVFESRYRDRVCRDADHLRNAILYTHANPVRAGLCTDPAEYRWSSHRAYVATATATAAGRVPRLLHVADGLAAFDDPGQPYRAVGSYVERLCAFMNEPPKEASMLPSLEEVAAIVVDTAQQEWSASSGNGAVRRSDPLVLLRGRFGGLAAAGIRARFAAEAVRRGHSGRAIARYLNLSESAVSRMLHRRAAGLD